MNIVQINQKDILLQNDGTNVIAYQNSANIPLHLLLETNGLFSNMVKTVTINIPGLKRTVSCITDWTKNPAIVTLPQDVFKCEGMIYIALFGTDGTKVINTNALAFAIDESNSTITFKPDDRLLEDKIMDVMLQWYEIKIKPDYELLKKNAEDQQVALNQRIEAFDDKIAEIDTKVDDGDFDGATIRHGLLDPTNDIGKDGDQYLNTSTTSYHLFFKENGTWIDKGSIRGIDGNNKILVGNELETSQPKTLFIQTITQAQAIAETRGITVNEYDARLPMSQVRINDEVGSQGLDEYISQKVIKALGNYMVGELGAINLGMENTIDPKTLVYEGNYVCGGCIPGTSPIDNVGCHITVKALTADNRTLIIDYRHNGTCWRNDMVNGVWGTWKLIAGEVLLWSGSISTPSTIDINYDIGMFGNLTVYQDSVLLSGVVGGSTYIMCNTSYTSGSVGVLNPVCGFIKIFGKQQLRLYEMSPRAIVIGSTVTSGASTISVIMGRP